MLRRGPLVPTALQKIARLSRRPSLLRLVLGRARVATRRQRDRGRMRARRGPPPRLQVREYASARPGDGRADGGPVPEHRPPSPATPVPGGREVRLDLLSDLRAVRKGW